MRSTQELLGYSVKTYAAASTTNILESLDGDCSSINLEVWSGGSKDQLDEAINVQKLVTSQMLGAIGHETLFAPSYLNFANRHINALQENTPLVTSYKEVDGQCPEINISRPMDPFPPDGTITPERLQELYPDDASGEFECTQARLSEAGWETSTCVQGRW